MLRITDSMVFQQVAQSVQRAQGRAYAAQLVAQSGTRVNRWSDDPVAASRGTVINATLERLAGMENVSGRAESELMVAEAALGQATNIFSRAREIAVAGASDSLGAESRGQLALEIEGLREQLMSLANSRVGEIYVFAGAQTLSEPFTELAGVISYDGDSGVRHGEIAPGVKVPINIPGDSVFSLTGGVDVFAVLDDLSTELHNNNGDGVAVSLTDLEAGFTQLNNSRAQVGIYMGHLRSGDELRREMESSALVHRTQAVEADINESFSDLAQAQFALQASVSQAQRILSRMNSLSL